MFKRIDHIAFAVADRENQSNFTKRTSVSKNTLNTTYPFLALKKSYILNWVILYLS